MEPNVYLNITKTDIWKNKLNANARIYYSNLNMLHCSFGYPKWFYHSEKNLAQMGGVCTRSGYRAKKMLRYYGLIETKKRYLRKGAGGRLHDEFHLCTYEEILNNLRSDFNANEKDLVRVGGWLSEDLKRVSRQPR